MSLEKECELAQSRCDAVVYATTALMPSIAVRNCPRYRNFAFPGDRSLYLGEDFIGRQYPIHRN